MRSTKTNKVSLNTFSLIRHFIYVFISVILIDDVLASLDAHVAKHIVKHCILGYLKNNTRIIVTENRTLFYHSNQILHVEQGIVSVSDYSLRSFESDIETESASSDEQNTPISFELNDEEGWPNKSAFDEIKESGSLSSRVLAIYWQAWGPSIGLIALLSIVLMQASKNFSDTWLAHWIQTINSSNDTAELAGTFNGTQLYSDSIRHNVMCIFERFLTWQRLDDCQNDITTNLEQQNTDIHLNSFYLAIYISIAIFNSAISLVRAFIFAYGGIKAAKFIHDRLLNSVFFVRDNLNFLLKFYF